MAKLFPIGIEVEEVAVGSVLRILNKTPGVAKLHLNLLGEEKEVNQPEEITQVMPPKRQPRPHSMGTIIAQALSKAPLHSKILREGLVRGGFAHASLPSQLAKMNSDGLIKKVGVGTWRITEKGLRHYGLNGRDVEPKQVGHSGPKTQNGSGVRRLVLTALNNGSQVLARDLRRILEDNQYSIKNMTGTVSKMKGEGLIKSDDGVYSLTDQGRSVLSEVTAQPMENHS